MEKRYVYTLLALLSNIICYADRTNIGIVILQFPQYNDQEQSYVLSSFFIGYILTQILGGYCSAKYGGKYVLLLGVLIWTISDVMTIVVYKTLWLFILARIIMGIGEGVNFPSIHHMCGRWLPINQRTTLVTIITSGQDLGTILSLSVSPQIINTIGWQYIFIIFGSLAFVWIILFYFFGASDPETHPTIEKEELDYIVETRRSDDFVDTGPLSTKTMLKSPGVWAIIISHFCFNYGWYVLLSYLPKYFKQHLDVDLKDHTLNLITPYAVGFIGMLFSGWLADKLINQRIMSTLAVRILVNSIGMFGPSLCLLMLAYEQPKSIFKATLYLTLALGTGRFVCSGYWTNIIDITHNSGQVMGLSNTIATIPGFVGNAVSGFILSHSSSEKGWSWVFYLAAIIYMIGGISYILLASTASLDDPVDNGEESKLLDVTDESLSDL